MGEHIREMTGYTVTVPLYGDTDFESATAALDWLADTAYWHKVWADSGDESDAWDLVHRATCRDLVEARRYPCETYDYATPAGRWHVEIETACEDALATTGGMIEGNVDEGP